MARGRNRRLEAPLILSYNPGMEHDKRLDVRVPEDLLRRIDEWRADGREVPAPRAVAIRFMLDWWLKENAPWLTKKNNDE